MTANSSQHSASGAGNGLTQEEAIALAVAVVLGAVAAETERGPDVSVGLHVEFGVKRTHPCSGSAPRRRRS